MSVYWYSGQEFSYEMLDVPSQYPVAVRGRYEFEDACNPRVNRALDAFSGGVNVLEINFGVGANVLVTY